MGSLPFKAEHQAAWIIAGVFALLSCVMTSYQVLMHTRYNCQPETRRYVIRIILMVPIYAFESWIGLRFTDVALYMDLLRECYEAFVIYSFYQLLVSSLGGERRLVSLLATKPPQPHVLPCCCLPTWRMSDRFRIKFTQEEMDRLQSAVEQRQQERTRREAELAAAAGASRHTDVEAGIPLTSIVSSSSSSPPHPNPNPDYSASASSPELLRAPGAPVEKPTFAPARVPDSYMSPYSRPHHSDFLTHTQLGTLQYCIVKPLTAVIAFVLTQLSLYGESSFDFTRGYPYLAFITNMSQIWAMYTLVLFYMSVRDELKPLRPIPKFLCVKAVVFFTFWQSVLLALLAQLGVLHATTHYTQEEIVAALQDFIVCLEMLLAALAHHYAFSWKQWHDEDYLLTTGPSPMLPALLEALNVTDVYVQDVRRVTTRSRPQRARDNPQLTREEIHERQYASFVAAQEGGGGSSGDRAVSVLMNEAADLRTPLNPDGVSVDLSDSSSSVSTYRAPGALLSQKTFSRVLLVEERDIVRERNEDGAVVSTTMHASAHVLSREPLERKEADEEIAHVRETGGPTLRITEVPPEAFEEEAARASPRPRDTDRSRSRPVSPWPASPSRSRARTSSTDAPPAPAAATTDDFL